MRKKFDYYFVLTFYDTPHRCGKVAVATSVFVNTLPNSPPYLFTLLLFFFYILPNPFLHLRNVTVILHHLLVEGVTLVVTVEHPW